MTDPPTLFPLGLLEPINPDGQVSRLPGVDAPCMAGKDECDWPFCACMARTHERKDAA